MIKGEGKRAAAHFEMIIAFLVFVGFVFFLFTVMKPYDERVLPDAALEGAFDSIHNQTLTPLETVTLDVTAATEPCIWISIDDQLFEHTIESINAKTLQDNSINAEYQEAVQQLHLDTTAGFYKLAFSPEFSASEQSYTCTGLETVSYQLGAVLQRQVLSLSKLQDLQTNYNTDYQTLKQNLAIPSIYDFSLESAEAGISMRRNIPETGEILAKEFITEVLNGQTGEIINARFNLRLW